MFIMSSCCCFICKFIIHRKVTSNGNWSFEWPHLILLVGSFKLPSKKKLVVFSRFQFTVKSEFREEQMIIRPVYLKLPRRILEKEIKQGKTKKSRQTLPSLLIAKVISHLRQLFLVSLYDLQHSPTFIFIF